MPPSLTTHLLSLTPSHLHTATTHPFLLAAATSTLPPSILTTWLAQDRLYALSYPSFIGSILSSLPLPSHPSRSTSLEWRVADVLIDALANIRREIGMFEEVARQEGWEAEVCGGEVEEGRATRCYRDLFAGATGGAKGWVVGLVVLWATEECYLRAWKFAKSHCVAQKGEGDAGQDVMARVFIPNWSSEEFEGFVGRLRGLVDEVGVEEGGWVWRECERAWRQVVWIESIFWPDVEGSGQTVGEEVGGEVKGQGEIAKEGTKADSVQ
ncbi:unnamed protein product [Zymoseptoria tritici ST99CH_3D1]|nr:unnamed protein product [Zymoseptoria tritici ST99CH_3D1]